MKECPGTVQPIKNKAEEEPVGEGAENGQDVIYTLAKYNALGVIGNENNNGDNVLCLGGEPN